MTKRGYTSNRANDPTRTLQYENLENRLVLSADPLLGAADAESALVSEQAEVQADGIFRVTVEVNGERFEITEQTQQIAANQGDTVRVVEVHTYAGQTTSETGGVFAVEGYVRKLPSDGGPSQADYADGRFSARADNVNVAQGENMIAGLSDSWEVQTGWDRINLVVMHYHESGVEVQSRFSFGVAVAEPDFQFDTSYFDRIGQMEIRVGDEVKVPVSWLNAGDGRYHNYAELDIYHASDRNQITWAGAVVGNADAENPVTGNMENTREGDGFEQFWTPSQEGEYILKFYLDPEEVWQESNESNNTFEVRLVVQPANEAPQAVDDNALVDENEEVEIDALANDSDPDGESVEVKEFSQGENGEVVLNENGTFTYTPDEGFVGEDSFEYTIADADGATHSATVYVKVEEADSGVVVDEAQGDEDTRIKLAITLETDLYEGVIIDNIPEGAELNRGQIQEDGSVYVKASQLSKLKITPPHNSDVDFDLEVTPVMSGQAVESATQTLRVTIDPVVDGARVYFNTIVAPVGQITDISGRMWQFDNDGSESTRLRLKNLPSTIEFTTGYRDGDDWWLEMDELPNTEISIGADYEGDFAYYGGQYDYISIDIDLLTTEAASGETLQGSSRFGFWVQRA